MHISLRVLDTGGISLQTGDPGSLFYFYSKTSGSRCCRDISPI